MSNEPTDRNKLATIIAEKAGSVSVCWSDISKAGVFQSEAAERYVYEAVDAILAAGYRKPRTIKSAAALEALPFGSAVQTSDSSDVVVLRSEGRNFRNQSGCELSVEDLWRYGTQPFTVIFEAVTA